MLLGSGRFLAEQGVSTAELETEADALRGDGATAIFIAVDGNAAGVLAIADPIKETTPEAVRALKAEGVRLVMMTGDNRTTADAVAAQGCRRTRLRWSRNCGLKAASSPWPAMA